MYFKKIKASNFKSFKNIEISLDKFNTIIGPNAAGKSNFLSIIRFFRDCNQYNLENAFSLQGNINSVRNIALDQKNIELEICLGVDEPNQALVSKFDKKFYGMKALDSIYSLKIGVGKNNKDFILLYEKWIIQVSTCLMEKDEETGEFNEIDDTEQDGFIKIIKKGNDFSIEREPENLPIDSERVFSLGKYYKTIIEKEPFFDKLLIFNPFILTRYSIEIIALFTKIALYDIDSKLPKKAIPFTGKKELEENGRNIAIVLNRIFQNKKEKEKFNKILNDILPFAKDLIVDQMRDESFITCLRESYHKHYFPAYLLSDGTINIVAMIVILFFEENSVIVLEEPDRNIHPQLLSRIIYMMEDVSQTKNKQIIITTHNPEIVRYTDLKKIITIKRDEYGFSQISKPSKNEEIKDFLKEMGVIDLFLEGIL